MLGQDHDGALAEQSFIRRLLQVGTELQLQPLAALVVGRLQSGLDAQQIARAAGLTAAFDGQCAQVG